MNYRERVAAHLKDYQAKHNLTNQELARLVGLEKGNFVAMLKNPKDSSSPMSLKLLRRMCQLLCLTPRQCALLVLARAKNHPSGATEMDVQVLSWVYRSLRGAARPTATAA